MYLALVTRFLSPKNSSHLERKRKRGRQVLRIGSASSSCIYGPARICLRFVFDRSWQQRAVPPCPHSVSKLTGERTCGHDPKGLRGYSQRVRQTSLITDIKLFIINTLQLTSGFGLARSVAHEAIGYIVKHARG